MQPAETVMGMRYVPWMQLRICKGENVNEKPEEMAVIQMINTHVKIAV